MERFSREASHSPAWAMVIREDAQATMRTVQGMKVRGRLRFGGGMGWGQLSSITRVPYNFRRISATKVIQLVN